MRMRVHVLRKGSLTLYAVLSFVVHYLIEDGSTLRETYSKVNA